MAKRDILNQLETHFADELLNEAIEIVDIDKDGFIVINTLFDITESDRALKAEIQKFANELSDAAKAKTSLQTEKATSKFGSMLIEYATHVVDGEKYDTHVFANGKEIGYFTNAELVTFKARLEALNELFL